MGIQFSGEKIGDEGYVYNSFGDAKYLKHAVASVSSLKRYDKSRGAVLFCTEPHSDLLQKYNLTDLFSAVYILPEYHQSITGFKHYVYDYMPFERTIFLDSDIIWCKSPDRLWDALTPFGFTISGNKIADIFFGGPKGISIVIDFFLRRRRRTLNRFGLTHLSRVQSGVMYASDQEKAEKVCTLAQQLLKDKHKTHFRSRKEEDGRSQESCEWSLAMALSKLNMPVYPWLYGNESPQLDFIEDYTEYNKDFTQVRCLLYNDRFTYDLKALQTAWLRKAFIGFLSLIPGKTDYQFVTPYCLHFGWYNQKEPFNKFAERTWADLTS